MDLNIVLPYSLCHHGMNEDPIELFISNNYRLKTILEGTILSVWSGIYPSFKGFHFEMDQRLQHFSSVVDQCWA